MAIPTPTTDSSPPPAWTMLHAHLHQTLKTRQLLPPQQHLLVAVSGGQDSVCLAQLLVDLQPHWQWHLNIAHCDHGWRSDSAQNAQFVQALANAWQIPYVQATATTPLSSEAAAREWRYQALQNLAQTQQCCKIVVGHTASDRAETLLYNLIRGSGADGLQALTWQRALSPDLTLIRPLLSVSRQQTVTFCQDRHLAIWADSTNQDLHYARNQIRLTILPQLHHLNPQVERALAQTAELLQADVDYLEAEATQLAQKAVFYDSTSSRNLRLHRGHLREAPLALQRRAIRQALQKLLPHAPNFDQIEKVRSLISAPNRSQTDPLPGGAIAYVANDWIQFQ
jgi:tRNA(Ile)-lysidine synthase